MKAVSERFAHHGEACTTADEVTHRYVLSDSGWWCLGCKKKLVSLIPPFSRIPDHEEKPKPTCVGCLKTLDDGYAYMSTIRTDDRVENREHP